MLGCMLLSCAALVYMVKISANGNSPSPRLSVYILTEQGASIVTPCIVSPQASCMVCSRAQLTLRINTSTTTLGQLLNGVVRKRLAVNQPNLICDATGFMYEEGEAGNIS